jgi:two-component system chemotaxis response regulator CheY
MKKLTVIAVDDERDIITSLDYDLREFQDILNIELCESGEEVLEVIADCVIRREALGLIITDQMMPEMTGVELIKQLERYPEMEHTKVIMLTGQATHQDTIEAINSHRLNFYISKPWDKSDLINTVKDLLSDFIIEEEIEAAPYMRYLNAVKLLNQGQTDSVSE